MEDTLEISVSALYEYRKDLSRWKHRGPTYAIGLCVQLCKLQYTKTLLQQTKINKTIKTILQQIQKQHLSAFPLYNRDQINSFRLKLHNLYARLREIRDEGKVVAAVREPVENQGDLIFQVRDSDDEVDRNTTTTDYLEETQRERYRDILIREFQKILAQHALTKENFRELNFKVVDDIDQKIVDVCVQLEKRIYRKQQVKSTSKTLYQDDLKTMIRVVLMHFINSLQYLQKDHTGQVFVNLVNGLFPLSEAIQLHLADWAVNVVVQRNMADNDADFYKDLRAKEITQAAGQVCIKCQNPYAYLIDERQIRRADEPSTKFYECFACGHRYKC